MRVRSPNPRGFSLIELMVVIAVIAMLVALLLPAVQSTREAARRTRCRSNLHQLGIGLQSYETTHRMFAINYGSGPFDGRNLGASWIAQLLPFIEQKPLWDRIEFGRPAETPANLAASSTVIEVLLCSSDAHGTGVMENRRQTLFPQAITNYKACLGSNWGEGTWAPLASVTGRNAGQTDGQDRCNGFMCRGGFLPPVSTRVRDLTDGSSNIIAVGEAVPEWTWHTWWYWFNATTATCAIPLNDWTIPEDTLDDWHQNSGFASRHPGGGQFTFADQRVVFISENINRDVYRELATIQGGEVVPGF
ncbi:MAG: DUF1559 domain-containing protein [Planctomycetaceae bacterium]